MSKILITSALPYINGVKHLGNLVGSLLPADVHARFRRQVGDEVLFICGTDEHGTPAELGAIEAGEDVRHYCDAQHAIQADIYRRFGLSFDHFGRSSCRQNHALTQHFYRRLDAAGLIEERPVRQVWSSIDRRFLPDRYVLGTCPHCGCGRARRPATRAGPCSIPRTFCSRARRCQATRASNCARPVTVSCANRCWWIASMPGSARARDGRRS
jgi:methionyl-tRNA synthetase